MEQYSNKHGYYLAVSSAIIYAFFVQAHFEIYIFLGSFITILILNIFLSGLITAFRKFINFGKVLGITSVLVCFLAILGNRNNQNIQNEKVEIEQKNLNTITSNFKSVYNEFNSKLKKDDRSEILNNLVLSNQLIFGDNKEVLKKLDEVDEYYKWINKANDSLFTDLKKQLNDYKNELKDERKKSEIDAYINEIEMTEMNASSNYMQESIVIFEMRNIISIKKRCKHEFKNGKILFFDTNCLDDWNKAEVKLNESIKSSNQHRENLLNKE